MVLETLRVSVLFLYLLRMLDFSAYPSYLRLLSLIQLSMFAVLQPLRLVQRAMTFLNWEAVASLQDATPSALAARDGIKLLIDAS